MLKYPRREGGSLMKKIIIFTSIIIAIAVSAVICVSAAIGRSKSAVKSYSEMTPEEKEAEIQRLKEEGLSLYINDTPHTGAEQLKKICILSGTLPEDQPSITLEQALEILESLTAEDFEKDSEVICNEFNKIAGCPDILWGSGTDYRMYAIDEDAGIYLEVCNNYSVTYQTPSSKKLIYIYPLGVVINEDDDSVWSRMNEYLDSEIQ